MARSVAFRLLRMTGWLGLLVAILIYLFPLYWLVNTSLKPRAELFSSTPTLIAQQPTLAAYGSVLFDRGFVGLLRNSLVVCSLTVLLTLVISLAITYPITRLPVSRRVRVGVLNWALSLRFLPPIAVVIPYFVIVRTIGLYNNPLALVFVYTLANLPFGIWMLKGFMSEVPLELEEAAYVDGATRITSFRRILLPLIAPGLLASAVIIFAFSWSEFLFALILTSTRDAQTLPVGVQGLVTQFEIIWNEMAAAGVIAVSVPLLLMFLARRYVLAGLTFGVIREK
ncbi:MAG: multiple sugar transport system permease protein [Chloroflexota bacterium]|nr:multiple sugar transport system permease protein [Chloroflexota bacterium]